MLQFGRGTLLVTWQLAAAADSDSVNIGLYIYGRMSSNGAANYSMNAYVPGSAVGGGSTDTTYIRGVTAGGVLRPMPTFYITRNNLDVRAPLGVAGGGTGSLSFGAGALTAVSVGDGKTIFTGGGIPPQIFRTQIIYSGLTGSCAIPLGDNGGNAFPFPYVGVNVANLNPRKALAAVSVDFWPRVN